MICHIASAYHTGKRESPPPCKNLNAVVLRATQTKFSQKLGLVKNGELDLNDCVMDDEHLYQWV